MIKNTTTKIGLVLAGGGAKGAYQSGVVKYLAEIDFAPYIIAGTSIGALNGAILASNTSFKQSGDRLWQLWKELGEANIINFQLVKYPLHSLAQYLLLSQEDASICDSNPLDEFLRYAINPQQLRAGIELWVATFPSAHNFLPSSLKAGQIVPTIGNVITATLGQPAEYIHVQSADTDEEIYQTLLASAAIPLAFKSRKIDGKQCQTHSRTNFTNTHNRAISKRKFCTASGNNKTIKRRSTNLLDFRHYLQR